MSAEEAGSDHAVKTLLPRPIHVEVVNINRLFHQNNEIDKLKEKFRKKYGRKDLSIEIDVSKFRRNTDLNNDYQLVRSSQRSFRFRNKTSFVSSGCESTHSSHRLYSNSQRFCKTISFDTEGNVVKEEFVETFLTNNDVFDEKDENDPSSDSDDDNLSDAKQSFQKCSHFTKSTEVQTELFKKLNSVETQTNDNDFQDAIIMESLEYTENNLNKPNESDLTCKSKLKDIISSLQTKNYYDKPETDKKNEQVENSNIIVRRDSRSLKAMFENLCEIKPEPQKSQISKTGPASRNETDNQHELLNKLLNEISKLPLYRIAEFEKNLIKNITDKEFLEITKERFKNYQDGDLFEVVKFLLRCLHKDDLYDSFESSLNDRTYSEGSNVVMKLSENFLNKKDLTQLIQRNVLSLSEANKRLVASKLLEDLPYDSLRTVLELQFPKLREKDIPNILNNISVDPNRRELEKAICILSNKLSGEETLKLVKSLGKTMKDDDLVKTIRQLFYYLPRSQTEKVARNYVEVKKFYAEKWTETKAVEVKRTVEKQVGTDNFVQQKVERTRKIVQTHGESWFSNDRKLVNRGVQTDAVNRLLFKDKIDLTAASAVIQKAKQRFSLRSRSQTPDAEKFMLGAPTIKITSDRNIETDSRCSTPDPELTSASR